MSSDSSSDGKNDPFQKYEKDKGIEGLIEEVVNKHNISPTDLLANFPVFARRVTLKRFMAYYDLYKKTVDLPGDIVELGVFRGNSLLMFGNFLEAHEIGNRTKKVWGFDNFKGFTELASEDGGEAPHLQKVDGGFSPECYLDELKDAINIYDQDRFIPFKKRIELVEGDVAQTVPEFVEKNPGLRISILHLDIDLYKPTLLALEHFFPLVVKGGIVIFDEYAIMEWSGESRAVDEYFKNSNYIIRNFNWTNSPGGYLIKE